MIKILFEHDDFLVCEKPAGQAFHTEDSAPLNQGFVSELRKQLASDSLFPVHRLDKVTSGVMLFAKTPEANSTLSQLFQDKLVEKVYLAVSQKKPKKKQGLISGDMKKVRAGSYKLCHTHENPAITRFYAARLSQGWGFWLMPKTGKTHQLRVACKSLGSPILGDERYGGGVAARCYLHAYRLAFSYLGVEYAVSSEPREAEFLEVIGQLSDRVTG